MALWPYRTRSAPRILADYDTARERDRAARAAAAAAEPDAKCAALDALTDTLTRRAETDPERIEADPEHPPASDPAPKLPEHLAAAAARVTEVGPRKVADPEAARRLAALDEPARSEPPARAAETAPAPAQNGKRPRGKERRKATEPAKRRRKRAADDARAQRRAELTADLERAADTPALLVAMARLTWADSHDGAECPADRIPGAADLAGWLPACPEDVWEALAVAERDAGGGVAWLSSTGPALAGVGIEGAHGRGGTDRPHGCGGASALAQPVGAAASASARAVGRCVAAAGPGGGGGRDTR